MTPTVSPRSVVRVLRDNKAGTTKLAYQPFRRPRRPEPSRDGERPLRRFLPRLARLPNGGRAFLFVSSTARRFDNVSGLTRWRPCFPVGIAETNRKGGQAFAESLAGVFAVGIR
jgi:hypothetical protein